MSPAEKCISRHRIMIHDRGAIRRILQIVDVTSVKWGRTLSGVGVSKVIIAGAACSRQADVLRKIDVNRHEMVVFRGNVRVWEGPIKQVSWLSNRVEIASRDVFDYVNSTPLSKRWPNADGGGSSLMTTRVSQIMNYELTTPYNMTVGTGGAATVVAVPRWETIDTPANILPFLDIRPSTTLLTRSDTSAFEMSVGAHIDNLADGGLDYTAIGRKILFWDSDESIGKTRTLTEADFYGEVQVYENGVDYASVSHVSATQDAATPAIGNAGGSDPYYGPWTKITPRADEEGSDDPTQDELNTQARRNWRSSSQIPLEVVVPQGVGIRLNNTLQINDLIPGVQMPVIAMLNLRRISQMQRLVSVDVEETAAGETVSVSLQPFGEAVEV